MAIHRQSIECTLLLQTQNHVEPHKSAGMMVILILFHLLRTAINLLRKYRVVFPVILTLKYMAPELNRQWHNTLIYPVCYLPYDFWWWLFFLSLWRTRPSVRVNAKAALFLAFESNKWNELTLLLRAVALPTLHSIQLLEVCLDDELI